MIHTLTVALIVQLTLLSIGTWSRVQSLSADDTNAKDDYSDLQHAILKGYLAKLQHGEEDDSEEMMHSDTKRLFSEFPGKRRFNEFVGKRIMSEFPGKRLFSEFVGKRRPFNEFVGKRLFSEFVGKRPFNEFVGKRSSEGAK